ncbi:SWI/SNF chromatin-remodeling complex subunit SNF5-like [Vespa mandarinia]|uniref:SWI/SNF chromatin-remodeling complex subunit SNF5-like n=1 Tax=Vespa mandarinia TaxID=7446 RepID=UPI00161B30C7|nr:SWI/SNF chromatin-remodeling complex subunit SNF5-like [Vespa mandarinia]
MSTTNGISGHGRDTHATAVSGGGRAGHPPSSTNDLRQEFGVGNLAPALDNASGSASQVGDLACGVSNASGRAGRDEGHLEEWQKAARAAEGMRFAGLTIKRETRKAKRARPVVVQQQLQQVQQQQQQQLQQVLQQLHQQPQRQQQQRQPQQRQPQPQRQQQQQQQQRQQTLSGAATGAGGTAQGPHTPC